MRGYFLGVPHGLPHGIDCFPHELIRVFQHHRIGKAQQPDADRPQIIFFAALLAPGSAFHSVDESDGCQRSSRVAATAFLARVFRWRELP